jgi:hypothetical protein
MTSGASIERRAKRVMEADGYVVDRRQKTWSRAVTMRGRTFRIGGDQDSFGCLDLTGFHPDRPVLYVQATAKGNASHRKRKVESALAMVYVAGRPIQSHAVVEVWTWGQWGRKGTRRYGFKVERYGGGYGAGAWSLVQPPAP